MTLSLNNSNKDFDFVGLSYQNFLANLFSQCKVSLCEGNTLIDVSSILALVKIVVASQHKNRQRKKSLSTFVDN